ncbi:retron system putative HNH endonuclease [Methylomonas rosea]|uniref:TIGR02646 family protein n=1 Tax=Methylomonas rosea TaxID=2952227 RepID=A0ABT1TTI9_9GAMM|nr:TIGR02646 family protein [Methylomonas sp. WSC-7]
MRLIAKGQEPIELTTWKKANPHGRYPDLDKSEQGKSTRRAIRQAAIKDQFGLCAYCCKQIDEANSTNEHIASQMATPNKTLDFTNIVASCKTPKRCNQARGSTDLPLTPLMPECETELKFRLSGKVEGGTERAAKTIDILGLDTKAIREERKQLVDALIYIKGKQPNELRLLNDDELKQLPDLFSDLDNPNETGLLSPFSPILVNIIKGIIDQAGII